MERAATLDRSLSSAVVPQNLRKPVTVIAELGTALEQGSDQVASACTDIADWSAGQGAYDVELEFRQAAALACPGDPRLALVLGKLHRDRAEYSRAESWLLRTVGLARVQGMWRDYILAHIALGKMSIHRGAYPKAKEFLAKAVRNAKRHSCADELGMALHDLHVIAADLGEWSDADRYAIEALDAYRPGHRNIPALAHDIAFQMMEQGHFREAHRIFEGLREVIPQNRKAYFIGSYARSAAGNQRVDLWEELGAELDGLGEAPGVAEAWVEIGQGGALLGRFDEALNAVERGEKLARRRGEGMIGIRAEQVRESIHAEMAAEKRRDETLAHAKSGWSEEEVEGLSKHVLQRLELSG